MSSVVIRTESIGVSLAARRYIGTIRRETAIPQKSCVSRRYAVLSDDSRVARRLASLGALGGLAVISSLPPQLDAEGFDEVGRGA